MALTPQSVRDKQFTPTRFKPGYDEDEVDGFLDEVEAELMRLLEENAALRGALESQPPQPPAPPPPAPVEPEPPAPAAALTPAPERVPAQISGPPATPGQAELEEMLRRTLLLAQRTADEAVAEARAEAARTVGAAREEAERTVATARQAAAETEREAAERRASEESAAVAERHRLETEVEQLKAFEREYRSRLRGFLQMQLRELESAAELQLPAGGADAAAGGANRTLARAQLLSPDGSARTGVGEQPRSVAGPPDDAARRVPEPPLAP